MIIYNKTWLNNLNIQDQVHPSLAAGDLTKAEFKNIEKAYPVGFYSPNVFVRSGLFLLTCIIALFGGCLLTYICWDLVVTSNSGAWVLFLGLISYIALEVVVKNKYHFRSGTDDALIWISGGLFCVAFTWLTFTMDWDFDTSMRTAISMAAFAFFLSLFLTVRFADSLMALFCFLTALVLAVLLAIAHLSFGKAILPFLVMLLSAVVYYFSWSKSNSPKFVYYQHCLRFVQTGSLLTLYLAGNYYVVQEMGNALYGYTTIGPYQVPYPVFFWPWTILVPFIYTALGLYKKNVILLRTGLVLIAIAAVTFKNYYHVLPIEGTLVLIGLVTLGGSYWVIRYLKIPKKGFTSEELMEDTIPGGVNVESLIIATTQLDTPSGTEGRFGGGDFGGGGSSSNF
ncbi:hypothetical protein AY601_4163 [Pedobacter cryoconitis]|uniref:Membrane protein DUF2157 n=1 Tax=Pedobacter cryoconitis TaxID=188932 RepID=A0A127VI84_9SPHI|nr:hypothetical protein [Pedobacter cryoconitis]AMQ01013.1 hypothetical protein AY601_4163 [Pedobacter cryoconitis]